MGNEVNLLDTRYFFSSYRNIAIENNLHNITPALFLETVVDTVYHNSELIENEFWILVMRRHDPLLLRLC